MHGTERFYGWRMVALAFLAFNVGLTVVINAFGPVLPELQREFGVSRANASLAFGVLMLSMGVLAPLIGNLAQRFPLRQLMITGCLLHATGFSLLAFARSMVEIFLLFGLLVGPACCLLAVISAPTLVSRWFERDRGKALGIGLVQIFGMVAAPLAAWLVVEGGRQMLFLALAGLFLVMIPVMRLVIERPEDVGQQPRRAIDAGSAAPTASADPLLSSRAILLDPSFWLISLAIGVTAAGGTTLTAHGPAMAMANGIDPATAATILTGAGGGALIGAFAYGWLIDKVGPFRALVVVMLQGALTWFLFAQSGSAIAMILCAGGIAAAMGPAITLHSACLNELYGTTSFSRAMGYSYFTKIPFLFGAAPLAGALFDRSGDYASTYAMLIGALLAAAGIALLLALLQGKRKIP